MFTLLNRLRGTWSIMSKVNGLLFAMLVYAVSNDWFIAILVGVLYIIGESFGWGEWVGTLTTDRATMVNNSEGKNNGIRWIASKIVSPITNWRGYCEVALTLRGLYWWICLVPLYWVDVNLTSLVLGIIILSVSFPFACYAGYTTSKLFNFKFMNGAWEHQEVWYGFIQDLVIFFILMSVVI